MFINTYIVKDVYNKGWQKEVCLSSNKINSNIITKIQQLDKNTYNQDICDNYVKNHYQTAYLQSKIIHSSNS